MKLDKLLYAFACFVFGYTGYTIAFTKDPIWCHWGYCFPIAPNQLPIGLGMLAASFVTIYGIIRSTKKNMNELLICPACESAFLRKQVPDEKCLKCGTKLEKGAGFYDRHPEFRDGEE